MPTIGRRAEQDIVTNSTSTGQTVTVQEGSQSRNLPRGLLVIQGLSADTVTLQYTTPAGVGPVPIKSSISSDGTTTLDPLPEGDYSISRSGSNDSITVTLLT